LGFSHHPASASKVVALVIGNESPENGLSGSDLGIKLKTLKDNLFSYGSESIIIDGMNLSKDEIWARIRKFEAGLANADLAIFYYAGLGAHSAQGNSYLVPQGWDGRQEDELVELHAVLERMRAASGVRGLVFLDTIKPGSSTSWQLENILPGLGGFSGEARPGSLQITVIDAVQGPTYSPGLLTGALLKQLQTESNTIRPPQLASQVQDEVSFDTGNIHVPRLFGSVDGPSELKRLSQEEFQAKQKRCMASREEAEGATKVASEGTTTVADASGRPIGPLGAEPARLGGRFWDWFCPEVMPNSRPPRDMTTRRQEQDGSGKRAGSRQADGPRSASPTRTSYQARSYSGGGAHRAAASGAPVP
jgi:hypothetical protein